MESALYEFYNGPQHGKGAYFAGSRRHLQGGGFLSTLFRGAIPLLKSVGSRLLGATARGASRYLEGEDDLPTAMKSELSKEALKAVKQVINPNTGNPNTGNPNKRRAVRKPRSSINKKRKSNIDR